MNSLNIVIRLKDIQLKCLLEKLQAAKLEFLFWENHFYEITEKKGSLELEIRAMRDEGRLKYAKLYDEHLLFLEEKLLEIKKQKNATFLNFEKLQREVSSLLQERKKFEKLQKKRCKLI